MPNPPSFSSFPDIEAASPKRPKISSPAPAPDFETGPSKRPDPSHSQLHEPGRATRKKKKEHRSKTGHDQSPSTISAGRHEPRHRHRDEAKRRYNWSITGDSEDDHTLSQDHGFEALTAVTYFSDRKGDLLNVTYDGLHSRDVPRYRLAGWGRAVLGLGSEWRVGHRGSAGIEISLGRSWKAPELTDRKAHALLINTKTRPLLPSKKTSRNVEDMDVDGFLPLKNSAPKIKDDEQSYRAITRDDYADSDSEASDSGTEDESNSDGSTTSPLSARQEALRSIEQRISADPTSVSDWITLLEYSTADLPLASKNAQRARSEIASSILSRALAASPQNAHSAALWLKYLRVGEDVWDESRLGIEWEKALKAASDPDLRIEWLNWRIRRANATIDEIKEDAVRLLQNVTAGASDDEADSAKLRVFWRIAVFFKESGFLETTTALFQAQTELLFKTPAHICSLSFDKQLDALEEFWDSEVPRVGEPNALGWNQTMRSPSQAPTSSISTTNPETQNQDEDPLSRWAASESRADRKLHLPSRTSDDNDDPYATILFSDIRQYLIHLRGHQAKHMLRLIWLDVLGLNIPGLSSAIATSSSSMDERWSKIHFASISFLSTLFPVRTSAKLNTADSIAGISVGKEREYRNSFGVVKEWTFGALEPLEGVSLDERGRMWESFDGDIDFVRRLLQHLQSEDDVEFNILALAFEAAVDVKSALKFSRTLLSEARQSTELWAAHARLERICGRRDKAVKVYQTVLSSMRDIPSLGTIYWGYAELEWLSSHNDQALHVIFSAAGEIVSTGGIALLRTKRWLDDAARDASRRERKERLSWIKLRMLLELLTGASEKAMDVAEAYLREDVVGAVSHEALLMGSLIMFYHYSVKLRNPCPPALLRERVHAALGLYPNNTVILGLFLECEKGEGIWGRVRELLGESKEGGRMKEKSLIRRVSEVWISSWDRMRWQEELERVRSGLEAAVWSDLTRGSAILWRIYMEFEILFGDSKRLKSLLYRALGQCPFYKELYLLAFGPLRSLYTTQELSSLADMMTERGIRLRTAPDEVMQDLLTHENVGSDPRLL